MDKTYLGDGLYASFDGHQVILSCDRENGEHWVALEPETLNAFFKYVEGLYNCVIKVESMKGENNG